MKLKQCQILKTLFQVTLIINENEINKIQILQNQFNELTEESQAKYIDYETEIEKLEEELKQSKEINSHLIVYNNILFSKKKLEKFFH